MAYSVCHVVFSEAFNSFSNDLILCSVWSSYYLGKVNKTEFALRLVRASVVLELTGFKTTLV